MKLATLPATGRWRQQEAISPKREHFGGGTQGQLFQRLRGQYQVQSRSLSHLERPSTTGGRGGGDAAATDVLRFLRTTSTQQRELRPGTGHQQRFTLRRRFSSGGRILGQQSLPSGDGIALSSRRRFSLPDENVDSGLVQRGRRSAQMEDSADSSMSGTSIPTTLSDSGICAGISALQGRRPYMEDESRIIPFLESDILGQSPYDSRLATHFFGVFDGHAGGRCSKSIAQLLPMNVAREGSFRADPVAAIRRGFFKTNLEFLRKADRIQANDGSTAITAFIRGRSLWVANVGDSRAVLVRGFPSANAIPLSVDHKPNRPEERRRIAEAGGRVVYMFGVPRVNGILAVSRAFGDRNMQGAIVSITTACLVSLARNIGADGNACSHSCRMRNLRSNITICPTKITFLF
jgi:serine/threonine protein phosphatase PrpC